ncbi:hypothetical protein CLAFUW4_10116 [Fulvia fulva]|uniref:Methyltransferase type 11 domain-containing protein n=1 Tax=Passalora fulva TaxID=5499 RepID=A0A9Q8LF24_PASFU|nr:uncharacterized protein CLAFUR5_04729 [Fulvia fulva]KAK4615926.1 hypothetical protein CLAFUR4_10120 [Fulvia fulva]KAK4616737.1 hypothetical protein CLAFUR0_10118 [Fulvia fulva]UJO16225.1 hypothetical protein CLAFUR5_04729 [Fulvia fulva]WPV19645.1 hypothetical protein CLAFUW4_10116 [Fulvia fulva]WPV33850.1 hypothetical protein CLAFUW7_10117 [Fulvia fulva]
MATQGGASGINARAQSGFAKSAAYNTHRPTYSSSIVQLLLENVGVAGKKHAKIIDLAAGTGKFTEALAAREEEFEIIAVEPHSDMRNVLESKNLPRVKVVNGTGEKVDAVEDGSIDAVVVAQGFHWFSNMTALKEIHRVLARHSALGLVWNVEDYNNARDHKASTPWEARLHDLTWKVAEEVGDEVPRFRHLQWRKVFDEQVKKTPLSLIIASDDQLFSLPIAEQQEPFEVALSVDSLWDRYSALGHIAALEGVYRERVRKTFMDIVSADEVEKNEKGEVTVHGNTYAVWTTKIPTEGRTGTEALGDVERREE